MHRRDLLKWSALSGVAGSSCATLIAGAAPPAEDELPGFLGALDGAMAALAGKTFLEGILPTDAPPAARARAAGHEATVRATFRSLLLVGAVRELTPEQLGHAGVQQRLRDAMGEFDDAVFGMTDLMEGFSAEERRELSRALREDPELAMRIMGHIDQEAAAMGLSGQQRARLRMVSVEACSRLRQSPDLALREYAAKVRKVEARHGLRAAAARANAAAASEALLFGTVSGEGEEGRGAVGGAALVEALDGGAHCGHDGGCIQRPQRKIAGLLTAGGILMGLSLTAAGVSLAAGFSLGSTLGAVVLIVGVVGLILVLSGLLRFAADKLDGAR